MKYILFAIILFGGASVFGQPKVSVSPNGNFRVVMTFGEESDLQTRYTGRLACVGLKDTIDLFNCVRHDFGVPNVYWSKDSKYLIFEKCSDPFVRSWIGIFSLLEKKVVVELFGLVGNTDPDHNQFDPENHVLIYFIPSGNEHGEIPDLYAFDLTTRKERKIFAFNVDMDIEFPQIRRVAGKRLIEVVYYSSSSGQRLAKELTY